MGVQVKTRSGSSKKLLLLVSSQRYEYFSGGIPLIHSTQRNKHNVNMLYTKRSGFARKGKTRNARRRTTREASEQKGESSDLAQSTLR